VLNVESQEFEKRDVVYFL